MIIYNVTVNIESSVHDEWIRWMKEVHIPDVMKSGLFLENRMLKVLGDDPDQIGTGGATYAIQYTCRNIADFRKYETEFAPGLRKEHQEKFKDQFVSFRTLLELVD